MTVPDSSNGKAHAMSLKYIPTGLKIPFFILSLNSLFLFAFYMFNIRSLLTTAKGTAAPIDLAISVIYILALSGITTILPLLLSLLFLFAGAIIGIKKNLLETINAAGIILWIEMIYMICIVDVVTYKVIGVHIYSGFVLDAIFNSARMQNDIRLSGGTIALIAVLFIFILVTNIAGYIYLKRGFSAITGKVAAFIKYTLFALVFLWISAISGIGVSLTHLTPFFLNNMGLEDILPFYNAEFYYFYRASSLPFSYPLKKDYYPELQNKKNVMMIMVESYRADAINDELSPNIMRFLKGNKIDTDIKHFSACHSTACANFSYLSGLNSYNMDYMNDLRSPFYTIELLRKNGYAIYGASTSMLKFYSKHLTPILNSFDAYEEFLGENGPGNELRMQEWISELIHKKHPAEKPFFLFVFINATHHNYMFPPEFEKYKPVLPEDYNHFLGADKLVRKKEEIWNRYKNSALFVDSLFGRLMKIFRPELEKKSLIFSLAGDHGEEFWDKGELGHAKARLINARIRTPFIFYMPDRRLAEHKISSHADIFPTIIDYLNPGTGFDPSLFFNGVSLIRPPEKDRYLVVSSYGFPYVNDNLALVTADGIMSLRKGEKNIGIENNFTPYAITNLEEKPFPFMPLSLKKAEKQFHADINKFFK